MYAAARGGGVVVVLKALGYSDKVLQESYNKVHEETDDLDSFLVATNFDHVFTKTDDRL
jgi:hypothetical protein